MTKDISEIKWLKMRVAELENMTMFLMESLANINPAIAEIAKDHIERASVSLDKVSDEMDKEKADELLETEGFQCPGCWYRVSKGVVEAIKSGQSDLDPGQRCYNCDKYFINEFSYYSGVDERRG